MLASYHLTLQLHLENLQASGNQVALSAAAIGATIQTRYVDASSSSADYQCSILGISRNYDVESNITSTGYFRLELSIGQIVYVKSNATTLSLDEISAVVETGFSRGQGGRLRFRSLLVTNPYFRTIVNVEVLRNTTSPTGVPVPSPSSGVQPSTTVPLFTPSMVPSSFPTVVKTIKPSVLLSLSPVQGVDPSNSPSSVPTEVPQNFPHEVMIPTPSPNIDPTFTPSHSKVPTQAPSNKPTSQSPSVGMSLPTLTDTPSDDRQVIVLGSLIGGIAFVLSSLFLVVCICLPFCCGQKGGIEYDSENASGSFPGHNSNLNPTTNQMVVPGILTLDEDAQSLANTTLDGKSSAPIFTSNQAGASPQHLQMNDSFDESSIYTSTTDPSTHIGGNEAIQASSQLIDETHKSGIVKYGTDDSNVFDLLTNITTLSEQREQNVSQALDLHSIKSETKEFDPFEDDNEHFADDESSFEFGSSLVLSDPSFSTPSGGQTGSLNSDETNRIEKPNSHTTQLSLPSSAESSTARQNGHRKDINPVKTSEKTPLESYLIDDQTATKFSTSKSVSSLQSAPSRLVALRPMQESKAAPMFSGRPPQHGNRRIVNHQSPANSNRYSTSSVGPSLRSRLLYNNQKIVNGSKHERSLWNDNIWEVLSINNGASKSKQSSTNTNVVSGFDDPFLDEFVGLQMPSTDVISEVNVLHHALPRQAMSVASYREEFDSPRMNLSRYGNNSSASSLYDSSSASGRSGSWLADTDEHTLDSDPRSASSHSTRMSRRRYAKSERVGDLLVRSESSRKNGMFAANGNANRSIIDEQKSADHAAGPYSWQSALGTYGASSISSSSTAGSGSRSTLSSRVDPHVKEQYEFLAPPGKINIVLVTDFHNGNGTVVSKVRATSALQGKLCEGDELGKALDLWLLSDIIHFSHCVLISYSCH